MKGYYLGYNRYGVRTANRWQVYVYSTKAERDAEVDRINLTSDQLKAEAITAKQAYKYAPCLRTGLYEIDDHEIIDNPNVTGL